MTLPDFLTRHAAELPAAGAIAAAVALVLAAVFLTGRRRRPEPIVGHYQCHACRAPDAVALVRLPHEGLARLACLLPGCRIAYPVVEDDNDPVGTLHRAHKAYLRVMVRGAPPRNTGRRKAVPVPAAVASPADAEIPPDWSRFGPVPLPGPVKWLESDTRGGNRT